MSKVIEIHDPPEMAGCFVKSFDAEDGLVVTNSEDDALEFQTTMAATEFWRQELPQGVQGHNLGGPNRPLTALTVTIRSKEGGQNETSS